MTEARRITRMILDRLADIEKLENIITNGVEYSFTD